MSDWIVRCREGLPDHEKLGQKLAAFVTLLFLLLLAVSIRIGGALALTVTVLVTVFGGAGLLAFLVWQATV